VGDAVVAVGGGDGPVAGAAEGFQVFRCVVHQHRATGGPEHGDVVPVVADGEDLRGIDAAGAGEREQGGALGASGGKNVEDAEVARGILRAVEGEFVRPGLGWMAGDDDAGMFQQARLGPRHALQSAAEHGLDGRVGGIGEGALDGIDLDEVGIVGGHPSADAGGEVVEPLHHQGAARVFPVGLGAVEGEDEGVAEVLVSLAADVGAEPEGGGVREVGASQELGGDGRGGWSLLQSRGPEGAGDGAVGADEDGVVVEAERAQDTHGEAVAATGGDGDLDSAGLGGVECGEVARADAAVVAQQRAVQVDCDQMDRDVVSRWRQVAPGFEYRGWGDGRTVIP